MLAIIIGLLLVTNVVTGLAVYYVATPAPASEPLRVIGPWAGSERDKFLPVLELFETQTGIDTLFLTTRQEDLQTLLPSWFAAKRAPADLIFMPSAFVKQYGDQGHAVDLAGTVTESNYVTGALDPLKNGTRIFGGAYTGKVKPGFWFNQSYFTANGFSAPDTWAEFEALLRAIDLDLVNEPIISGDGVGWPLSDVVEHFIATYGGPNMHRQLTAGTLAWTDPTVKAVFQNYLVPTLTANDVCGPPGDCWSAPRQWDTGVTEWWRGDYGLYFMGSWITGMVPTSQVSNIGVFSLPEAPGAEGIVFAADYFFVPSYSSRRADALRLAAFLGSSASQARQVQEGGHIATVNGVAISNYPAVDARIAGLLTGKEVLSDLDDTIGAPFQGIFWSQLQALWANPSSWETVLANIEAAAP